MFDLGIQELIVIFAVALLVFGPKRLPELGRAIGKAVGQFRSMISDVKTEVDRELHMADTGIKIDDLPAWKRKDEGPLSQIETTDESPASEEAQASEEPARETDDPNA